MKRKENKISRTAQQIRKVSDWFGETQESTHQTAEAYVLLIRNILVVIAAIMFILGTCPITHRYLLKGIGYILGAAAYFCELLAMTDLFSRKVDFREKFMIYCFGPLYLMMAVSYFIEHFELMLK